MKEPLFVIGNPRSGTTLLRLMLTNHPNIVIPPECGFAVWLYDRYHRISSATASYAADLTDFIVDLRRARKIETWKLDQNGLNAYLRQSRPASYAELVSEVYQFYGLSLGRTFRRWGDKNNFYINHITTLKSLFPEAYFIHIVRDVRDVACSYKTLNQTPIHSQYAPRLPALAPEIAEQWRHNLEDAIGAFESFAWARVHEVRYEDLVSAPRSELKRICDSLGERYDDAMLRYHEKNRLLEQEPKEFLQWKARIVEEPVTAEIGKYKSGLTVAERQEIERIAKDLLHRYRFDH